MHDFDAIVITEHLLDFLRLQADDLEQVFIAVVDHTERELLATLIFQAHDVTAHEVAVGVDDADREQTAAFAQGGHCAFVQLDPTASVTGFSQHVAFARFELADEGAEAGTHRFAGDDIPDAFGVLAVGDDYLTTGATGELGGLQLGVHATGAQSIAGAACHLPDFGGNLRTGDVADDFGVGIAAWVGGVEAVLIGEEHQQVGFDDIGDQGGEVVVIAQADFLGADGVVFVDDRHHAVLDEGFEGVARVEVAAAVGEVLAGEQHLPDRDVVVAE